MTKKLFKDQCDKCGKFDILKGINGKCLCPNCIKEQQVENKSNNFYKGQLSLFDLEVLVSGK